ncbi:MAG: methylated-DNA--[protein]-cysteine S-methyltransferase [Deltaproteobacteria bacterium]|nr:methylated-DNA--[protein]-cysteine S-methyltransferase [Deltaproteobacteria bacterium]MBW2013584.1 methylated-DNA--[protein]-cysteine S-methyltransferase [Deltaproteobacteria bacterium]
MTCYLIFKTPLGHMAMLYRVTPFAVIKILLPSQDKEVLVNTVKAFGRQDTDFHDNAFRVNESIIDYFKGKPIPPPWGWLEMGGLTKLQQSVLESTANIPYGGLRSYRDIAVAIGRPRAYRFVGSTLANNPFPILIPCHRVIRSNGSFGRFGGGSDLKRKLIELEAG